MTELNLPPSAPAPVIEERLKATTARYGRYAVALGAVALLIALTTAIGVSVVAVQMVNCTTPGPHTPTEQNPRTGHGCYDDGRAQTGDAIVVIVDEVDRRTCIRMQEAFAQALQRPVTLTCTEPPPRGEGS